MRRASFIYVICVGSNLVADSLRADGHQPRKRSSAAIPASTISVEML